MKSAFLLGLVFVSTVAQGAVSKKIIKCEMETVVDRSQSFRHTKIIDVSNVPDCGTFDLWGADRVAIPGSTYSLGLGFKGACAAKGGSYPVPARDGFITSLEIFDSNNELIASTVGWGDRVHTSNEPNGLALDIAVYPNNIRHRIQIYCSSTAK